MYAVKDVITVRAIGVVRSEHTNPDQTPVQPVFAQGCRGTVEVFDEYAEGLRDIEGFSHIYLLFHLDRARSEKLIVKPCLDDVERGVFSTRSPRRPNFIGLSVVELLGRKNNVLFVDGLDILDGTPLLDIKPYTAGFDQRSNTRNGWYDGLDEETVGKRGRQGFSPSALIVGTKSVAGDPGA